MEKKLSEELRQCLDERKCTGCDHYDVDTALACRGLLQKAYERIKMYEDMFPCEIGQTVYVLAECKNIPNQLDGTLYSSDGSPGTATGYYCPYEDDCPFDSDDFDGCETHENQTAVFKDTVSSITIEENAVYISTENCCVCSEIGKYVFLTREQADAELKKSKETEEHE